MVDIFTKVNNIEMYIPMPDSVFKNCKTSRRPCCAYKVATKLAATSRQSELRLYRQETLPRSSFLNMVVFGVVNMNNKQSSLPMPWILFQGYTVNTLYNREAEARAYHKALLSLRAPAHQTWGRRCPICLPSGLSGTGPKAYLYTPTVR